MKYYAYTKKNLTYLRPFDGGSLPSGCSVSPEDKANGSPKEGDWIAINPDNPEDTWLVNAAYHEKNYVEFKDCRPLDFEA